MNHANEAVHSDCKSAVSWEVLPVWWPMEIK